MTRILVGFSTLALLAITAGPAPGQGFTNPPTLAPTVRLPVVAPPGLLPGPFVPRPFPGIGYPWFGGYGYSPINPVYVWTPPVFDSAPPPAPNGPPAIVPELPAEWTIEFPAIADVTLNGAPAPGDGTVRKLTSPALKPGATYTFAVTAQWTTDGKQYEWDRTLTLGSGQRSRSTVTRGFLVGK